jgi:tetratricopeptide (TPR) repeat protein
MRALAPLAAALLLLFCAQQVARPSALEQRADWPPGEEQKGLILQHLAPILGPELTADLLWAKTLVYYGGGYAEGSDFRYLEAYLDAIIDIDPNFKRVYRWAAYAVTMQAGAPTQDEFRTSIRYLEKAMEAFPDDPEYPWIAGMRYYFDLESDDPETERQYREKGARLIETAMRKPNAPDDYASLAATMLTKLGQHQRALRALQQKILTTEDKEGRATLLRKLRYVYKKPDFADELRRATRAIDEPWQEYMPFAPRTLFIIFGEPPDKVIEFDELATDRDLFGAQSFDEIVGPE